MSLRLTNDIIEDYIADGLITAREHPELPLRILNYTAQCQYGGTWNEFTMNARGLVVDDDANIVARGFKKFFNIQEHGSDEIPPGLPVAFDKIDGSLILVFRYKGHMVTATRGSFTSEQAVWAKELVDEVSFTILDNATYLYELIHPENRIVVDYGDRRELVYLGTCYPDGQPFWYPEGQPFLPTNVYTGYSVDELPHRTNAEGFVLVWPNGFRVKVKYDDYVAIHRAVFGLTGKKVLTSVREERFEELRELLPEEFHEFVDRVADEARVRYTVEEQEARSEYDALRHLTTTRRDFAREAIKSDYRPVLFCMLDRKPYEDILWQHVEDSMKKDNML